MNISYVTTYDAKNVHNWSGLGYYIAKSLENQGANLEYIGNLEKKYPISLKIEAGIYKILGKSLAPSRTPIIAKNYAAEILTRANPSTDIFLSPSTIPLAFLETNKPKVVYTDATFSGMIDFYFKRTDLCEKAIEYGHFLEKKALESCSLSIFSSQWAADSAIDYYKLSPEKVKVVPFGANIECNRTTKDIEKLIERRSKEECNLLFLGVEWERKGGAFAVDVVKSLREKGINAILHVVGIDKIPVGDIPNFVINHGFISKSTNEGTEKLNTIIANTHFLIAPTTAEAYGLAFCEVNSFGVPAITFDVGGVKTIISDGLNGKTFPLGTYPVEFADEVEYYFTNWDKYKLLAHSAFHQFSERFNWNIAGRTIMSLLDELV
jgi:glycosyltransferase involved in cell wall biosynthesis